MFTAIGVSIKQFFTAITVFFTALERVANATNHLAGWGEDTAAAFADNARIDRAKQIAILNGELRLVEETANATAPVVPAVKAKA